MPPPVAGPSTHARPTALPRPGRVSVWLERRSASIASDSQGRHWLVGEYQLINAPQGLTTVNIPTWTLNTQTGEVLSVAQWPLSVGPLTARTVRARPPRVAAALKQPGARNKAGLQRRVAHLKSWVDALEHELGAHAGSAWRA